MGLFGGKLPELAIQPERADGIYYPGETVRAALTVAAEDGAKFKEIRAGLLLEEKYQQTEESSDSDGSTSYTNVWRTSEYWVSREVLASAGLPEGFRNTYRLEWRLPESTQPYCQGKIVVARWLVKATVDRTLARDVNAESPIYLVVPPPGLRVEGGELAEENSAPDAVSMRFGLPRFEFVQGETVGGRLLVEPRQDISARSILIKLVRHEVVPGGDRTNVEDVIEGQQQYQSVQLRGGQPVALDFGFTIPPKWSPTYSSEKGHVTWRVAATIDLAWKRDIHAWQSISVFNGAAPPQSISQAAASQSSTSAQAGDAAQVSAAGAQGASSASVSGAETQAPKFCRNCGGALAAGALFCGNCGTQAARA